MYFIYSYLKSVLEYNNNINEKFSKDNEKSRRKK